MKFRACLALLLAAQDVVRADIGYELSARAAGVVVDHGDLGGVELPDAGREVLNAVFLYHCVQAGLDAAIVNPAVGLATFFAQKALQDPIEKMVAFEYEVTGTWQDPVVTRKRRPSRSGTMCTDCSAQGSTASTQTVCQIPELAV